MGLVFRLAIDDAMRAPIEFEEAREPDDYISKYLTGGAHSVSKGEFTDDTSMALAIAEAFIEDGGLAPSLIKDSFLKWKNDGAVYGYTAIPVWMIDGLQWSDKIASQTTDLLQVSKARQGA